jgi:hypothetical protein
MSSKGRKLQWRLIQCILRQFNEFQFFLGLFAEAIELTLISLHLCEPLNGVKQPKEMLRK